MMGMIMGVQVTNSLCHHFWDQGKQLGRSAVVIISANSQG